MTLGWSRLALLLSLCMHRAAFLMIFLRTSDTNAFSLTMPSLLRMRACARDTHVSESTPRRGRGRILQMLRHGVQVAHIQGRGGVPAMIDPAVVLVAVLFGGKNLIQNRNDYSEGGMPETSSRYQSVPIISNFPQVDFS